MPHLCITAGPTGPGLHGGGTVALPRLLRSVLAADHGPVVIMVHGYKYQPGHPRHCPFQSLLSPDPDHAAGQSVSWPRRLGLRGEAGDGLGLSFGWDARGSVRAAFDAARHAGRCLARLIAMIDMAAPTRPVHLVAHSMGARVALEALRLCAAGQVQKAVLLAGAEFQSTALQALTAPGGAACAVLNVTSRENDLFDFLLERLVKAPVPASRMIGGDRLDLPNAVTLQLDDAQSLTALRGLGFPIGPPARRICHWSGYRRAGVFPLYRAFLADALTVASLRRALPRETAPRWSRLLPFAHHTLPPASAPVSLS